MRHFTKWTNSLTKRRQITMRDRRVTLAQLGADPYIASQHVDSLIYGVLEEAMEDDKNACMVVHINIPSFNDGEPIRPCVEAYLSSMGKVNRRETFREAWADFYVGPAGLVLHMSDRSWPINSMCSGRLLTKDKKYLRKVLGEDGSPCGSVVIAAHDDELADSFQAALLLEGTPNPGWEFTYVYRLTPKGKTLQCVCSKAEREGDVFFPRGDVRMFLYNRINRRRNVGLKPLLPTLPTKEQLNAR